MFRPRIIPVLLLRNKGLVKSKGFKDHKYIGDPINAVKIFNDHEADELVFLDIDASREKRIISLEFVREVGEEANMPFSVGGGIRSIENIRAIIQAGAEKVIINSYAIENPDFVLEASESFGSSTIVICMDVKREFLGKQNIWKENGTKRTNYDPVEFAMLMEKKGAGELIVQSIEKDGSMDGYDLELIKSVADAVSIPVIALGGAGNLQHMHDAYILSHANGLAAGSIFVYHGNNRGVLINYPEKSTYLKKFTSRDCD